MSHDSHCIYCGLPLLPGPGNNLVHEWCKENMAARLAAEKQAAPVRPNRAKRRAMERAAKKKNRARK